jgi:hypothetical protein
MKIEIEDGDGQTLMAFGLNKPDAYNKKLKVGLDYKIGCKIIEEMQLDMFEDKIILRKI